MLINCPLKLNWFQEGNFKYMAKEKNIKDMALEELESKLIDYNESLFNLRFQRSLQQLEHPQIIRKTKKEIARVKTYIRQYQLKIK